MGAPFPPIVRKIRPSSMPLAVARKRGTLRFVTSPIGAGDKPPHAETDPAEERRRAEKQRRIYDLGIMDLTRAPRNLPAAIGDWREPWRQLASLPKIRRRIICAVMAISTLGGLVAGVWLAASHAPY
jgi:hypothetical protein